MVSQNGSRSGPSKSNNTLKRQNQNGPINNTATFPQNQTQIYWRHNTAETAKEKQIKYKSKLQDKRRIPV